MQRFGVPVTVAINHFTADTPAEIDAIVEACAPLGVSALLCRHWAEGGAGALALAEEVARLIDGPPIRFDPLYPDALRLEDKIRTIAREIYRAGEVALAPLAARKLDAFEAEGFGNLPICMAKTQYSFSADPKRLGAPVGFVLPVRDVRLAAGAGFVVALCGDIMTMPGLPRVPAAETIRLDTDGLIQGLF
jgi:formate--tetrahydrofolate ligase